MVHSKKRKKKFMYVGGVPPIKSIFDDHGKKEKINKLLTKRLELTGDPVGNFYSNFSTISGELNKEDVTLDDFLLLYVLILQIKYIFPSEEKNISIQEKKIKEVFSSKIRVGSGLKKSKINKRKSSKKLRTRIKKGYLKTLKNRHNFKKGQKKTLKSKKGGMKLATGILAAAAATTADGDPKQISPYGQQEPMNSVAVNPPVSTSLSNFNQDVVKPVMERYSDEAPRSVLKARDSGFDLGGHPRMYTKEEIPEAERNVAVHNEWSGITESHSGPPSLDTKFNLHGDPLLRLQEYTSKPQIIKGISYNVAIEISDNVDDKKDKIIATFTNTETEEKYTIPLTLIGVGIDKIVAFLSEEGVDQGAPVNPITEMLKDKVIKFNKPKEEGNFGEKPLTDELREILVKEKYLIPDERVSDNISIAKKVKPLNEEEKLEIAEGLQIKSSTDFAKKILSSYVNFIPFATRIRLLTNKIEQDGSDRELIKQYRNKLARIVAMGGFPADIHLRNWGVDEEGNLMLIDSEAIHDNALHLYLSNINLVFLSERNIFTLIKCCFGNGFSRNNLIVIFFIIYKIWTVKKSLQKKNLVRVLDIFLPAPTNFIFHLMRLFGTLIISIVGRTITQIKNIRDYLLPYLTSSKSGNRILDKLREKTSFDDEIAKEIAESQHNLIDRVDQCLPRANMYLLKDIKYNDKGEYSESESGTVVVTSGQRIIIEDFNDIDNTVKISIPIEPPIEITGVPSNLYKKLKIGDQVVNDDTILTVIGEEEIPEEEKVRYTIGTKTGNYGNIIRNNVSPDDIKLVTSDSSTNIGDDSDDTPDLS